MSGGGDVCGAEQLNTIPGEDRIEESWQLKPPIGRKYMGHVRHKNVVRRRSSQAHLEKMGMRS